MGVTHTVTAATDNASYGTAAAAKTTVAEGATTTITATPKSGYAFDHWTVSGTGATLSSTTTNPTTLTMGTADATVTAYFGEACDIQIYSLTDEIGSAVVTADDATVTAGTSLVMSNTAGRIKLTPASGKFKNGDKVEFGGTIGNTSKNYGLKIYASDGSTSAGEIYVAGTTSPLKASGTLSLASDQDYIFIARYDGTTTTLTSCEITRVGICPEPPSCSDDTGLAYGETTVNKVYGDASFTNTLTNSNSLSVTYSSSNTDVATVNPSTGAVTIKAAGTATITASWAGDASYCEDEVSYTLNVKPAVGEVSGTWDRFGGETISLSVSPTGGSSYSYQWKKWYNDQWNNVSNGTVSGSETSGATTNNLQITNCTKDHSGSYCCVVTSAGQTNETPGYQVKVYVLECYNGGTTVYNFTRDGENLAGSLTIDLDASTAYEFKVHADNDYYGNNGTINSDATNWVLCNSEDDACTTNLTVNSGLGGTFTFAVEYSSGGNSSKVGEPELSVTYPRKTIYLSPGVWDADGAKFAINYWREGVTAQWTDFMTAYTCDGDILETTIPQWNGVTMIAVRLKNTTETPGSWDDKWNQTGNLTVTSNDYIVVSDWDAITYNSTYSAPTYEISFAANGGSGSMSSISSIACDADQQITANSFTKTGYSFAGWKADVNVKIGGETISAGTVIANSSTIQNIRGNIALTAQWTEDKHSVTVAAGSNGTVSPSSVSNIGIATASSDITATANTGYHFTSWTLPSGTSAASTYSESSNPIRINATADGKTITANFSANTPTITLDDQDATNTPTGSVVATYGSSMPEIATLPTKTGYTFGGFYSDVAGGGTQYYTNTGASAKNSDLASATTLYALWTQTVTIDDNGGSADGSVDVTYKGTAGTPSVPTYAGHTVDLGYYAESSCTNKVMALDGTLQTSITDGSSVVWTNSSSKWAHAGSSTLYAHWKCNTPEISCSSNTITISVPSGATVYYTTTTNGSDPADPTSSSTAYNPSSKPTISADTKIKAIAIQDGCTSSTIASGTLTYVAAGTSYYLFTPTSAPNPVHTGTLSGDFITDKSVGDGTAQTIDGNEFSKKSITIAGSTLSGSISGKKAGNYSIDYDVKTTSTTFYVYVSGANTSIYMHKIRESGYTTDSIVSQSTGASTGVKLTFTLKSKENTRVCFSTGNTSVRCYQIVAVESGDALPQACDEGYELNFNSGRYAYLAGSSNQMTGSIDGLDICSYNSYQYKNSTALELTKNSKDTYISFTTGASACAVKVTFSAGTLILNTSKSTSGGVGLTSNTAANLSASTTYYIINTNTTNRASITKIAFEETAASTYTVSITADPDGYGTVSSSSVTSVASGTTLSASTNTLSVGATNVTATATSASAEYTYAFSNWKLSDGSSLPSTVTADLSVYANFTRTANNYTLTWNTNGGSDLDCDGCTSGSTAYGASITAPTDPTLSNYSFDGWKTNNDGTGTAKGSTMPAATTTYYAAWKQTVTLTTGAQGSGDNQTPYVYLNGTGVSSFTAHTADGYTLQGYYTAGSGGVKVLNANGTFAASAVTDYITSSKWSRTGAAPTLYAQWLASEDCSTSDFVIKKGSDTQYQGCMESSSYDGTATSFTAGSPTTVGNAKMTISTYSDGAIKRPGSGNTFSIVIESVTGYHLKSICWAGKVENDETVSYYWDSYSGSATTISPTTTSGTGITYNAPNTSTTKFTASYVDDGDDSGGIWWRNVQVEVCADGGTTYNVTYDDNGKTGGAVPSDATDYSYGTTVTVKGNTESLEKTNYTFAGWTTNDDGTGSSYEAGSTFSITDNTTLYAKWTQSVTLDKNGGSTDGSATAVWNATGLTGITHAKPTAGYKLLGYYSASSDGTKVLNSDGSFAATNVTGYITSGKWSRTSATTLYAEYESAGALTWNLIVNSDTANLSTSTKTSAFTEISTSNMTDAALTGLTYSKGKKSSLTGKIETKASYNASEYVSVSFQVASGYKFIPSSVKVIAQPVTTGKNVKLALSDNASPSNHSLVMASDSAIGGGTKKTVTLAGDGSTYFTGTVTLKIYCYGATDAYRLGTPITIEGEIEETCGTMPSYTSMSYTTTTFAPNTDASGSPITIVGGDNIDTYQWVYNTVNDRTSGTNCGTGTSLTPLTDASAATDGTRYYWCEMTNDACGITIKSPAVAITVAAAKSDATVAWTDPASTPNYGGGGYTIKATVNQTGWDGNAADLVITAPAGINIYNVKSGTTSSQKWVQADFDVQTSFDRSTYASNIPFSVSAAATASYNAISNDHNVSYSACAGDGEGSSYNIRVRKAYTKGGPGNNYYYWDNTDGWISSPNPASSISSAKASSTMATEFDSVSNTNAEAVYVRTYHDNIKKIRIYADFRANNMTVSNVYKHNDFYTANSKYEVDYSVVYNGDEENENLGTSAQGYVDITLSDVMMSANDILLVKFNTSRVRPLGAVITESSAGSLNTYLQWSGGLADRATVAKYTTDAYFTYSASKITENTNTLGTITYSSSDPSVATVDATGKVALVAAGSTTIKATLAASGCYKKAEISYTLNVTEVPCEIAAGTLTLTSGTESKCSGANVTLTLTGFESDASIQWKDGDTNISNGGNYTIATDGTTSTLTTDQEGTYSVMVTKDDCSVRSNRITISNKSTEVGAKRIVKNWYIKNGRLTPDIELWTLQNGAHLSSVTWDPANATGLTASDFYESDGKVYLKGKEPSSNTSGADINYTLTLTVEDDCGSTTDMSASGQLIYLHHQQNTDKHVLAFVVSGTDKGGFTEGITAAQTTSVPLYNEIAENFDVLATNIRSTDDEQALKEYYSQFDILCITDYPNTGDKGVNKKSYVDALGALVDIRPILTMEAWVSKLANWKAKGLSGNPKSPTTRQYTMDLQCKDHEIFAGTDRTKVGEGDEAMYRVSMVDNTKEDYATLDATYGDGAHADKSGYEYASKPALQGFTFTEEMANDLLPIGLIDDGAGNPLQVGIERQRNMEARLMVLGINSYAMERLTEDGEQVVINALNYLMKKNAEDIADCSIYFTGGDEDEDEATRYNWNVDSHWSNGTQPISTQKVRILAKCVIPSGVQVHVTDVLIVPDGPINHGVDVAKGSLTIEAGGALIVDGKVEETTAPNYFHPHATSAENLVLKTSSSAQAALIFDNEEAETQATVHLYSLGKKPSDYEYQYFAVPMEVVPVNPVFANETHGGTGIYTYVYSEASSGWERRRYYDDLFAFEGLGITTKSTGAMNYIMTGNLASTATKEITLTHDGAGLNLIGNSWMAPIQIAALAEDNTDANITETVYIYCAGRDAEGGAQEGDAATETAGQWIPIPFEASGTAGWRDAGKLSVIPAMQAFEINVSAEATLTLDYDKVVRGSTNDLNAKLRAPGRRMAANEVTMTNIRVADSKTHTDLSLFEGDSFSEAFDNGWEAEYRNGDGRSAKLYAETEAGQMAVAAMYDYEGTVVGFAPGQETEYTFSFMGEDNGYYLNDIKLHNSVRISEGETYTFTYEEGDAANRFYISRTAINAPEVATGMENLDAAAPRVQKIIYNDKLYIIRGGRLYDATGKVVK